MTCGESRNQPEHETKPALQCKECLVRFRQVFELRLVRDDRWGPPLEDEVENDYRGKQVANKPDRDGPEVQFVVEQRRCLPRCLTTRFSGAGRLGLRAMHAQ